MEKRNWSCNPICSLCFCQPETTAHILTQCKDKKKDKKKNIADAGIKATKDDSNKTNKTSNTAPSRAVGGEA
jgi:hypothetical protein